MNMIKIRNSAIAATAAVAMVAATSLANPTEAQAGGKALAAGIIGGLVLGGVVAAATAPAYAVPVQTCHLQKQQVWNATYGYYTWQTVRVCY